MKICPKCHKNIPSDAKVCPYCGTAQSGYQPMKRSPKRKKSILFYLVAVFVFFFPLGLSYYFTYQALDGIVISDEETTLKTYEKSDNEVLMYQYDNLKDFSKNVKNSKKYVNKINKIEKELETIVGNKIEKEYLFQITDNYNLYTTIDYHVTLDKNTSFDISYAYDLSKENDFTIKYQNKEITKDINLNELTKYHEVIKLFTNEDSSLVNELTDDFLKEVSNYQNETISHYGKGLTKQGKNSKACIRIFNNKDKYRVKLTYDAKLKTNKFI